VNLPVHKTDRIFASRTFNDSNVTFGCAYEVLHCRLILGTAIRGVSCFETAELDDGYALQRSGLIGERRQTGCQNPTTLSSDDRACGGRVSVDAGLVRN
jgi:hypothetical protein